MTLSGMMSIIKLLQITVEAECKSLIMRHWMCHELDETFRNIQTEGNILCSHTNFNYYHDGLIWPLILASYDFDSNLAHNYGLEGVKVQ